MSKTVLLAGFDGYIGHALTLRLLGLNYNVIGLDDFRRRNFVSSMDSFSAVPIQNIDERINLYGTIPNSHFEPFNISLEKEYGRLDGIISVTKPDIVVNLAQQPSAPYSHRSDETARITVIGNVVSTMNLLASMKRHIPNSQLIQIGTMGEYDPAVGVDIAEGLFQFEYKGKKSNESIFPRRPGSIYHTSKVMCTYYIDFACRTWGLKATDIMQGVVFGNWIPEVVHYDSPTRFDSDEAFGTVVNRFIVQTLLGHPLTVYGRGEHKRGFLSLNDSIQCLILAIQNPPNNGKYRTWNQLDKVYSMNEVAREVQSAAQKSGIECDIMHIETPRVERTDDFYYNPETEKLKRIGFDPTRTIEDEALYAFEILKNQNLSELKKVVLPKIRW